MYCCVHAVYKEHKVVLCDSSVVYSNWFIHFDSMLYYIYC